MNMELIRQLTPEERSLAMRRAAWDNVLHSGSVAADTFDMVLHMVEFEEQWMRTYAAFWDEMREEKWPRHYFETKSLMAAGPLGWLCWVDDE